MASKEKNIELTDKMNSVIKQLKVQCKDARFADKLIKEILSLKGQIDVIPSDDTRLNTFVLDYEHNYGSAAIKRGTSANIVTYVFANKGYRVMVSADSMRAGDNARSLFTWLEQICLLQERVDNKEELPKELIDTLEAMIYTIDNICNIPQYGLYDDEISIALIKVLNEQLNRILEPLINAKELQKEDPNALAEMKQRMEFAKMLEESGNEKKSTKL